MNTESRTTSEILPNIGLVELIEKNKNVRISKRHIQYGELINIGGQIYEVSSIAQEMNKTKNERDELYKSMSAFELLKKEELINSQILPKEYCLRNVSNGNILFAIEPLQGTKFFKNNQSYFLRFNGSMKNIGLHEKYKTFSTIDIKFSPCLFGVDAAYLLTESGKKVPITDRYSETDEKVKELVTLKDSYSFYEHEIVFRLLGTIYFLAQNEKQITITSNLPRGAYYTFLFSAYEKGFISKEMLLEWFDSVDAKVNFISKRIANYVKNHIPTCVKLSDYAFLDSTCDLMRNYVTTNPTFDSKELLTLIHGKLVSDDEFAQFVFAKMPFPETFRELADLSYVLSTLNDMSNTVDYEKRKLNVLVYDITESKLLDKTRQLRNMTFLTAMKLFNPTKSTTQQMDHLSYIGVMTTEHIVYNVSDEFIEKEMYGLKKLYGFKEQFLSKDLQNEILRNMTDFVF